VLEKFLGAVVGAFWWDSGTACLTVGQDKVGAGTGKKPINKIAGISGTARAKSLSPLPDRENGKNGGKRRKLQTGKKRGLPLLSSAHHQTRFLAKNLSYAACVSQM
jgi:hypothetical protein